MSFQNFEWVFKFWSNFKSNITIFQKPRILSGIWLQFWNFEALIWVVSGINLLLREIAENIQIKSRAALCLFLWIVRGSISSKSNLSSKTSHNCTSLKREKIWIRRILLSCVICASLSLLSCWIRSFIWIRAVMLFDDCHYYCTFQIFFHISTTAPFKTFTLFQKTIMHHFVRTKDKKNNSEGKYFPPTFRSFETRVWSLRKWEKKRKEQVKKHQMERLDDPGKRNLMFKWRKNYSTVCLKIWKGQYEN